jgi:hypothetical protein
VLGLLLLGAERLGVFPPLAGLIDGSVLARPLHRLAAALVQAGEAQLAAPLAEPA